MELTKADAEDCLSSNPDSVSVKLAKDWLDLSEERQHLRDLAVAAYDLTEVPFRERFGDADWRKKAERWRLICHRLLSPRFVPRNGAQQPSVKAFLSGEA